MTLTESLSTFDRALLDLVSNEPGSKIPPGAVESEIEAFEAHVGYQLPPPLRQLLQISNGPCIGPGGMFGIGDVPRHLSIVHHLSLHREWNKRRWIPIAGDGCGNYYVLVAAGDFGPGYPIAFVEPMTDENSATFVAASNIWIFLDSILRKEMGHAGWPYNASEVIKKDPAILQFSGVRLPWDT